MKTIEQKIADYNQELGVSPKCSIDALIDSHRRLRELNAKYSEEINNEYSTTHEHAYKTAIMKHEGNFISIENLKKMTIAEIAEYLD